MKKTDSLPHYNLVVAIKNTDRLEIVASIPYGKQNRPKALMNYNRMIVQPSCYKALIQNIFVKSDKTQSGYQLNLKILKCSADVDFQKLIFPNGNGTIFN